MHALPATCLLCGHPTLASPSIDGKWLVFHCENAGCGPARVRCDLFSEVAASPHRPAWRELAGQCRSEGRLPCFDRAANGTLAVRYVALGVKA